jgi:hypothetical protein
VSRGTLIIVVAVAAVVIITCIIFAIPFNTISIDTIETYEEIETKKVPYTVNETYVTTEIREKVETIYDATPISVPHGISVKFAVTQDGTRLVSSFILPASGGFYLYAVSGKILYERLGSKGTVDIAIGKGEYEIVVREGTAWNKHVYLNVKLKWSGPEEISKYREVIRYRDEPYTVEKQRTVTKYEKVSLWDIIFGDE